jgi:hypothetical protein
LGKAKLREWLPVVMLLVTEKLLQEVEETVTVLRIVPSRLTRS